MGVGGAVPGFSKLVERVWERGLWPGTSSSWMKAHSVPKSQATLNVPDGPKAKGDVSFLDCIGTHQETGDSPCEEESGLSSQKEASENRLSKDRGRRKRELGLACLCSHWDRGHGQTVT